jgi:hypothetical protein
MIINLQLKDGFMIILIGYGFGGLIIFNMKKITAMRTAKELAFEAFMVNVIINPNEADFDMMLWKIRFENWWNEYYVRGEHKNGFNAEHFVMIDRKVYIQAE